jgi:hypothetical protein
MSVFLLVKVELPFDSITQLNQAIVGDSTKPQEGIELIRNELVELLAGSKDGIVSIATRETDQAITAQGQGISATYNRK